MLASIRDRDRLRHACVEPVIASPMRGPPAGCLPNPMSVAPIYDP
jgi:hypothetical protein